MQKKSCKKKVFFKRHIILRKVFTKNILFLFSCQDKTNSSGRLPTVLMHCLRRHSDRKTRRKRICSEAFNNWKSQRSA